MATLSVDSLDITGLNATYVAADVAGDAIPWSATAFLHVVNGDTVSHTATIASQFAARPGVAPADIAVAIPAGEERFIGPFDRNLFRNSDGNVAVSYDAVTGITVAAIKS